MAAQSSASVMIDIDTERRGTVVCWIWSALVASMSAIRPAATEMYDPSACTMSSASCE
jgi:hypothetical protein